jgi:hypothetical protein
VNEKKGQVVHKNEKTSCLSDVFVGKYTIGIFQGTVAKLSVQKKTSIQRYLTLLDSAGDSIVFRIFLSNTESPTVNFDESRLIAGRCVTVQYQTDIVKEEGIEVSRFYYALRLDYM